MSIDTAEAAGTALSEDAAEGTPEAAGGDASAAADAGKSPAQQQVDSLAAKDEAEAAQDGEPKDEEPPKPRKFKLKGEERELDEDELADAWQTAQKRREHTAAANKRFEEATALRKEAEKQQAQLKKTLAALKEDPFAIHRQNGWTQEQIDQFTFEHLTRRTQEAEMAKARPEEYAAQQRLQQLQAQINEREAKHAEYQAQEEQRAFDAERAQHEAVIERELPAAVEKIGMKGVPEAAYLTQVFAVQQIQATGQAPDFAEAAATARDLMEQAGKAYVANLSPEALEKAFPDLVKRIRTAGVARVAKPPAVKPAPAMPRPAQRAESEEFEDPNDFFRALRRA